MIQQHPRPRPWLHPQQAPCNSSNPYIIIHSLLYFIIFPLLIVQVWFIQLHTLPIFAPLLFCPPLLHFFLN